MVKAAMVNGTHKSVNLLQKNDASRYRRIALIPAYNEARFIGSVVLQVQPHVDQVVVVDDGSSDDTADTARAAGAIVCSMPQNAGKASAISQGIRYIRRLELFKQGPPTVVVMIDGDGQHDASQIPALLAPIEQAEADIVIGSRFIGIKSRIPRWRVFGQHALTLATNVSSGVHSTDSQSGFRAFAPSVLPYLDFSAKGFSLESEMQFIIREHDLRLVEVPISVVYEEPPKRNPIKHGLEVLNGILRLVGQSRPLFFFGLPSLLLLFVGGLIGLWVVDLYQHTSTLAMGYALTGGLLSIMGGIGFATAIILHTIRAWLMEWLRRVPESEEYSQLKEVPLVPTRHQI